MKDIMLETFYKQRAEFYDMASAREKTLDFPEDVTEYKDVAYSGDDDKAHCMDIFRPSGREGEILPVIVNVHGGGMIIGSKEFNRYFCAGLCKLGYVVFSIEYRLVPDVMAYEQYADVSQAMDFVRKILPEYKGNPEKVYAVADSGGANLLVYTAAMRKSVPLAEAARVRPTLLDIKAIGLISGMFYTTRFDKIGIFMPKYLYGRNYKKSAFAIYTNPEHPDIIKALPPCYLMTSHNDNLQHYTLKFAKALGRYNMPYRLVSYPENERMKHAFVVFDPFWDKSLEAIEDMLEFLNKY